MEKTRAKKGEKYWVIKILVDGPAVCTNIDWGDPASDAFFESGNYFRTEEEAEEMASKLRAVLNGVDVIEMPSKEELVEKSLKLYGNGVDGMIGRYAFYEGIDYLKSKIVK